MEGERVEAGKQKVVKIHVRGLAWALSVTREETGHTRVYEVVAVWVQSRPGSTRT